MITDVDAASSPLTTGVPSRARWSDGLAPVLIGWVASRFVVAIGYVTARFMVGHVDAPTASRTLGHGLFMWDGTYYRDIANYWYLLDRPDAARFFPLYPGVARFLGPVVGGRSDVVLIAVNNVAALLGALVLWKLVDEAIGDRAVATRSAWMVAIAPPAFVLSLAYTEGVALLLTAMTLLLLQRGRFVGAGATAFFAAMLRPVGAIVIVPILIEVYQWHREQGPIRIWRSVVSVVAPVAGFATSMWWISRSYGDLLLPFSSQQEIRGGFQDPISRLVEAVVDLRMGAALMVVNAVFSCVLVALLVVAIRSWQPVSWIAFAAVSLIVLMSSQVIDSLGRYGLVVVPFVVALATWARTAQRQVFVAVASVVGGVYLTAGAWLGLLVP